MRGRPGERAAFISVSGVLFQKLVTVMKHELVPVMKPDPWQRDEVVNVERRGFSRGFFHERPLFRRAWLRCCPCQRTGWYLVFRHGPSPLAGVVGSMPACPLFPVARGHASVVHAKFLLPGSGSFAWWGSHDRAPAVVPALSLSSGLAHFWSCSPVIRLWPLERVMVVACASGRFRERFGRGKAGSSCATARPDADVGRVVRGRGTRRRCPFLGMVNAPCTL